MSGARTEEPTPRRLREARRRGEGGRSRELVAAAAFAAGLAAVSTQGATAGAELAAFLRASFLAAATADPAGILFDGATRLARAAAPLLLAPAGAAALAGLLQSGVPSLEPLRPRLDRLHLARGLRRVLSPASAGSVLLGLGKAAAIAALVGAWLATTGGALAQLPRLPAVPSWRPVAPLAGPLAATVLVFGLLDLALASRRHRRSLRMTRDEVRREAKEDEGDPQHRAERRRLHRDLLEAGPVSKATVVVVNPTHVAVALRHDRTRDEPPRLLAKGTGEGAARIRSAARRAGVPIVRDVALARAVARLVEVGGELPEPLFDAAATVLVHVYGLEGRCR